MKINRKWLKKKEACIEGLKWFDSQSRTDPIEIIEYFVRKKIHLDWANWLIVRVMEYKEYVSYAIFAAEQVLSIFETAHPGNDTPRKAIEAAKKCIDSPTEKNIAAAYAAAADADAAADAAYAAADAAAYAAADAAAAAASADAAAKQQMRIKILSYGIGLLERGKE